MRLSINEIEYLEGLCKKFRRDLVDLLHKRQTGHPGGSLSVCEILTTLYFHQIHVNPEDPHLPERDRVVLCKGHAAPMLYRVLAEKGFFPVEELSSFRTLNSRLQGHPSAKDTPGVEISTGPLGIGLSASLGIAMGLRLSRIPARVYAIMGDGEMDEGTVWEAFMCAAKFKEDKLTAIIDWNGVQLDGTTNDIMPLGDLKAKITAFGWSCFECNGHDVEALCNAYAEASLVQGKPSAILAKTIKGKGISFMEGKNEWHGKPINDLEYEVAMKELIGNLK